MKRVATILFLLFCIVQSVSTVSSLFTKNSFVFIVDEEKESEKNETEKKLKKDYTFYSHYVSVFNQKKQVAFQISENIQASPILEKHSPPPDFN